MTHALIKEIKPQAMVTGRFLILEAQLRSAKNGSQFVSLRLGDKSGEIAGKIWDADEQVFSRVPVGRVMELRNLMAREFAGTLQLEIDAKGTCWRILDDGEIDYTEFLPAAPSLGEELWRRLDALVASVREPSLAALLGSFFGDPAFRAAFGLVPAALKRHHVYIGGLLEHTAGVASICEAVAGLYPLADRDLLLTGALLHDIGKIASYKVGRTFEGTDEGKLLGHLVMGMQMAEARIMSLRAAAGDPAGVFPEELRLCLEHMLASHHGIMEWGSPVEPLSLEACLLHHADNMDAQATKYINAIGAHEPTAGLWTNYDASVGRSIYTGRAAVNREAAES